MATKRKVSIPPQGLRCKTKLSLDGIVGILISEIQKMQDPRTGSNIRYSLKDVVMSAFSMFSIKDPSLLHFEDHTSKEENLKQIFKIEKVPSDSQMRRILDNLPEDSIDSLFSTLMQEIQGEKVLDDYVSIGGTVLVSIDGTGFFSSNKLFNKNCIQKKSRSGEITYHQQLLGACIVKPGEKEVFSLCPEAIVKQDGSSKNDCEMNAFKRLIPKIKSAHSGIKFTIVADALFSNAPVIELLKSNNMDFILGAKPKSNSFLFNKLSQCQEYDCKDPDGTIHKFKFINNVSVNESNPDCKVNFVYYEEINTIKNKKQVFSWISSHSINKKNVFEIMLAGRARWKIENETFNTLKNQGYNLEHNYGLGNKNLSIIFAKLMLLAFFADQIQQRFCLLFKAAEETVTAKIRLWEKIRYLFCSPLVLFSSMEEILQAIVYGFKDPPVRFQLV